MNNKNIKVGFVGTGFIGKNLANNFEKRGYKNIVRYSLEKEYIKNKDKIKDCDIVFAALPTPTTPDGFDASILVEALDLVGKGSTVVIKSTITPTTARELSVLYPKLFILHSPEFLDEDTADNDTDFPERNIIGIPDIKDEIYYKKAKLILEILPHAKYELITGYEEAALIKYGGNCYLYMKNIFFNTLYDLAKFHNCNWEVVVDAITNDPRIHPAYTSVIHKGGRGAGGNCLVKDFATFATMCKQLEDKTIDAMLEGAQAKNITLLMGSNKNVDILEGVYGKF